MLVIWTCEPASMFPSTEAVVPVVHRRGPAVRVARINAQAERTAGGYLWIHRGEHRAVCHISHSPALRMGIINGRELRVAPQFGFPLRVGHPSFAGTRPDGEVAPISDSPHGSRNCLPKFVGCGYPQLRKAARIVAI
jgi:hypothetical protein